LSERNGSDVLIDRMFGVIAMVPIGLKSLIGS
jgi:hypothetical protein